MTEALVERRKMVTIPQEEFEAMLERAAERGARHALAEVGLDGADAANDNRDLVARIQNASDTLKMLFAAWARYEMEDVPNRQRIKDMRQEWGKMARIFLNDDQE